MQWLRQQSGVHGDYQGRNSRDFDVEGDEKEEDKEAGVVLRPPTKFLVGLAQLYVRKCYSEIFAVIKGRYDEAREYDGIVVTGNPGVGKSSFLSFVLYCMAALNVHVVYESTVDNTAWMFNFSKQDALVLKVNTKLAPVELAFEEVLADRSTVFLFDTDANCTREPVRVTAFTIIAASPKKIHFKVFLDRSAPSRTLKLHMPVWSLSELLDCHTKTNIFSDISTDEISSGFNCFGGIPRYVMSTGEDRQALMVRLRNELQQCQAKSVIESVGNLDTTKDSHMLLHYELTDDTYRMVTTTFASTWVFEQLAEKWEKDDNLVTEHFVRQTSGVSELGGARGYALERVAHRKLAGGGIFKVRRLHEDRTFSAEQIVELKALDTIEFDKTKFDTIPQNSDAYFKSTSKTFPVVDSVSIRKSAGDVAGFQVTVSLSHRAKHKTLKQLLEHLSIRSTPFRLFFVVPEDKFAEFKFQPYLNYQGKGTVTATGVVRNVEQWVLLLPIVGPARPSN